MSDSSSTKPKRFGFVFSLLAIAGIAIIGLSLRHGCKLIDEKARAGMQVNRIKQLILACRVYAEDHNGEFPSSLEVLHPDYIDQHFFHAMEDPDQPVVYYPGNNASDDPRSLLLKYPLAADGKTARGYTNGTVMLENE